ncbi:PRC-barrel domain-containing protein [Psychromarinibacter sp. C21-152]|uniref:PRC-barrel domain-containing protein n=1 Tax=Psychromarinibacter sediminicola TaxID=3033385 RepID=A0AAE3NSB7_9RHOB|nr:PRC-barrel domain-containing protein [Psychromarinibacter sediminicola]MDF0601564.1 PRC-barrel domain-containing protein [Psychromarinibacter sediminicola]
MLLSYNDLRSYAIRAVDERTGNVNDVFFDDHTWRVRYLVAHTGFLLTGRESLIGTARLGEPDATRMEVPVDLTEEELKSADRPEADAPVSQQPGRTMADWEAGVWPPFLVGTGMAYTPGLAHEQLGLAVAAKEADAGAEEGRQGDPHLRSMSEVSGYTVAATDGEIGSVSDFLIDPADWRLRHLVIDTGTWLPGRRVVVTTDWIEGVSWPDRHIHVDVDKEHIENAPPLDTLEDLRLSPAQNAMEQYGAIGYWPI